MKALYRLAVAGVFAMTRAFHCSTLAEPSYGETLTTQESDVKTPGDPSRKNVESGKVPEIRDQYVFAIVLRLTTHGASQAVSDL